MREAFREKRTTPQLLHAFYARRQSDGEDLRDYSHALSQLLNTALLTSPNAVTEPQLAIRDQFIEGVRDFALRRELRRQVREKPQSNLLEIREEAIMWSLEDCNRTSNVARNRNLVGESIDGYSVTVKPDNSTESDLTSTLQEVVKIIAQQGKAIGELTNAVRELNTKTTKSAVPNMTSKPKVIPRYTEAGQPICLRCEGIGHMAKQCPTRRAQTQANTNAAAVQGNETPRLL